MKQYDKLVRDCIPDIICANQQRCRYSILSDEDFLLYAEKKLDEELAEFHKDHTVDELADLMEVILAIANAMGYSADDVERIRKQKYAERGGFSRKIVLHSVE